MSILVLNAGSTSLKFGLFDAAGKAELASGSIDWADGDRQRARCALRFGRDDAARSTAAVPDHQAAAAWAINAVASRREIHAVGHRVVYGGTRFVGPVRIDASVKSAIAQYGELAPLHNPPALAAIEASEVALRRAAHVAVFDTAFFAGLPLRACLYPLPYEWYEQWGVRRIGFHGISNAYCALRAAELLGRGRAGGRLITCHLGGGCSATAVNGGVPVATTMGFTPMEGLMMSTRCGSFDPGVLLHLQRRCGLTLETIGQGLNHRSGLLGVSGVSSNLVEIEAAARAGNARAQLALEMFADRVRAAIGALAVGMGGLEVLIFTARIGESSPALRDRVCAGLECLGVRLDAARNAACAPDAEIQYEDSAARVLVIHTCEELMIARETARIGLAQEA